MNRLPQQLEQLRVEMSISKLALAERAEKSRSAVANALSGTDDTTLSVLEAIGRVLGVEFVAVPSHLRQEVAHFVACGGQALAQPAGLEAPKSGADAFMDAARTAREPKVTAKDFDSDPILNAAAATSKAVARALDTGADLPVAAEGAAE